MLSPSGKTVKYFISQKTLNAYDSDLTYSDGKTRKICCLLIRTEFFNFLLRRNAQRNPASFAAARPNFQTLPGFAARR